MGLKMSFGETKIISVSYIKADSDILYTIDINSIFDLKDFFDMFNYKYNIQLTPKQNLQNMIKYYFDKDNTIIRYYSY